MTVNRHICIADDGNTLQSFWREIGRERVLLSLRQSPVQSACIVTKNAGKKTSISHIQTVFVCVCVCEVHEYFQVC